MSSSNALLIEVAAKALAAGLTEPGDLRQGHGLSADDIVLAGALAAAEPGNVYAIAQREHPEVLAIKLDMAARLIGMRLTTVERVRTVCLADRDDAENLATVIEAQAREYGAPRRADPSPSLLLNDGGVLPSIDSVISDNRLTRSPPGPSGADALCLRGRHAPGPINEFGWATCTACGTGLVTAAPGGPVYFEGGNAPINVT
jgi:hypothetical protein